eukprot:1241383-Pyramimonas_sp.AAC.1
MEKGFRATLLMLLGFARVFFVPIFLHFLILSPSSLIDAVSSHHQARRAQSFQQLPKGRIWMGGPLIIRSRLPLLSCPNRCDDKLNVCKGGHV